MYCIHCGHKNAPESRFCEACGKETQMSQRLPKQNKATSKKVGILALIFVIAIAAIAVVISQIAGIRSADVAQVPTETPAQHEIVIPVSTQTPSHAITKAPDPTEAPVVPKEPSLSDTTQNAANQTLAERLIGVWEAVDSENVSAEDSLQWPGLILLPDGTMVTDMSFFHRYKVIEERMAFTFNSDESSGARRDGAAQILEMTEETLKLTFTYSGGDFRETVSFRKRTPANVKLADISGLWRGVPELPPGDVHAQLDVWWLLNDEHQLALWQTGIPEGGSTEDYGSGGVAAMPFAVKETGIMGVFRLEAASEAASALDNTLLVVDELSESEARFFYDRFFYELTGIRVKKFAEDNKLATQLEGTWDDVVFKKGGTFTSLSGGGQGYFRAFAGGKLEILNKDDNGYFVPDADYSLVDVDFPDQNTMRIRGYGSNEEIRRRVK